MMSDSFQSTESTPTVNDAAQMARSGARVVDVTALIDGTPAGSFQYRTLALCMGVLFFDGYDTQAVGYAAPALVPALHIERSSMAGVFAISLVGLMIGACIFGPLADRFGRKKIVIFSTALFGVFSLATATATSLDGLLLMRFLTGCGLGGAMPNAVSLSVDYFPRKMRTTTVAIVFVGFTIGATVGGYLAAAILPAFGWQSVFYVGGALPLLLVPVLIGALPESIRLLILHGSRSAEIARNLAKIKPSQSFAEPITFTASEENAAGIPVKHLFTGGRAPGTTLIWIVFFLSLLVTFLLASWMPLVINSAGISLERAVAATATLQLGAIVGTLGVGWLMDKFNPYTVLTIGFILAGLSVGALTTIHAGMPYSLIVTLIFLAGAFFGAGGIQGANALAGSYYPTYIRSTGLGWALGVGRIGAIVGTLIGGVLVTLKWDLQAVFFAAAFACFCSSVAIFVMRRYPSPEQLHVLRTGTP
jgi:AAHS family 4-hydroxybenzoate transporter-like MFS transporter